MSGYSLPLIPAKTHLQDRALVQNYGDGRIWGTSRFVPVEEVCAGRHLVSLAEVKPESLANAISSVTLALQSGGSKCLSQEESRSAIMWLVRPNGVRGTGAVPIGD